MIWANSSFVWDPTDALFNPSRDDTDHSRIWLSKQRFFVVTTTQVGCCRASVLPGSPCPGHSPPSARANSMKSQPGDGKEQISVSRLNEAEPHCRLKRHGDTVQPCSPHQDASRCRLKRPTAPIQSCRRHQDALRCGGNRRLATQAVPHPIVCCFNRVLEFPPSEIRKSLAFQATDQSTTEVGWWL